MDKVSPGHLRLCIKIRTRALLMPVPAVAFIWTSRSLCLLYSILIRPRPSDSVSQRLMWPKKKALSECPQVNIRSPKSAHTVLILHHLSYSIENLGEDASLRNLPTDRFRRHLASLPVRNPGAIRSQWAQTKGIETYHGRGIWFPEIRVSRLHYLAPVFHDYVQLSAP